MKFNKFILPVVVAGLTANLHAQGDIEAVNYTGGSFSPYPIGFINNDTIGWAFIPSQGITIDSLGYLYSGPSSAQVVSVGLWSTDGTLLRSIAVGGNSVSINGNYYESINPISISAGNTYIVAVGTSGQTISFATPPKSLLQQPINYAGWAYLAGSGFTFPTPMLQPDGNDPLTLFGATFLFQTVPEPSEFALGALGALLLSFRPWRIFLFADEMQRDAARVRMGAVFP
jgi:Domain of unknown function (DUF4082)